MERRTFGVDVDLGEEPDVPLPVKETFYRIAQEAINNAVKHAHPTRLSVTLSCADGSLSLVVADDGTGFDPAVPYPGHLGLRSMQERAERVGAAFAITSEPQGGCRVLLTYATGSHV